MLLTRRKYSSSGSLRASCSHFWLIVLAESPPWSFSTPVCICLLRRAILSVSSSRANRLGNRENLKRKENPSPRLPFTIVAKERALLTVVLLENVVFVGPVELCVLRGASTRPHHGAFAAEARELSRLFPDKGHAAVVSVCFDL